MPPHLHPRSRLTMTLFTSTLAISFLVVGMPHLLPCPVPQRAFADGPNSDPTTRRRRRRKSQDSEEGTIVEDKVAQADDALLQLVKEDGRRRECPVPKPRGLVGQILGFPPTEREKRAAMEVRIEKLGERRGEAKPGIERL